MKQCRSVKFTTKKSQKVLSQYILNFVVDLEPGLNQARRKLTPILSTSSTLEIPDGYTTNSSGEKFLVCDTMIGRKKRLLIFASPKQIDLLCNTSILFMDGTFLSSPPFFNQVFTKHGMKYDCDTRKIICLIYIVLKSILLGFPCVFALLPDRKKTTYQFMFQELKRLAWSTNRILQPERIITDFETGLIPVIAIEVNFHCTFV